MLTRLIQRTETVSEDSIEYEYRDAEYEYEEIPEQNHAPKSPIGNVWNGEFLGGHSVMVVVLPQSKGFGERSMSG